MHNQYTFSIITFLSALFICLSAGSIGADTLDPTFGNNGVTTTSLNHYGDAAKAVAIDEAGKILVAGVSSNGSDSDFSLARYNQDGSLDETFNFDGIVTTQIGSSDDQATSIALQKDGKIVVAGYTSNDQDTDFALARYNNDGSLDLGFGLDGIVVLPIGIGDDMAHTVAVNENGTILIAGSADGTSGKVSAIARIRSDGPLDTTFGHEGVAYSGGSKDTTIRDLLIDENGHILVTGDYKDQEGATLLLERYHPDGTLDTNFGLDGAAETAGLYLNETAGTAVALREDGAILIAGSTGHDETRDIALFRFSPTGHYDPSFGTKGVLSLDINGEADGAYDIAITEDRIVIGGYTTTNGLRDFVLLEYSNNPPPKQTMSLNINAPVVEETYENSSTLKQIETDNNPEALVTTTPISSFDDTGYGMAVQEDGKIILVGSSGEEGMNSFALARYTTQVGDFYQAEVSGGTSYCIITTPLTEIRRTSAFTGGTILRSSACSFGERGVVYSIVPYPVFESDNSQEDSSVDDTVDTTTQSDLVVDTTQLSEAVEIPGANPPMNSGKVSAGAGAGQYGALLKNLSIGTRYYVRAYAITTIETETTADNETVTKGGEVLYGNQFVFETKDACFIATAAYGSVAHPHVTQLRTFRDQYLMNNLMGRKFVKLYYHYSPAIADTIDQHPILRPVVRTLLLPFVGISSIML